MSTTETNKTHLLALLDAMGSGRLMEAFETYYADDVVMSENGEADPARVGKAANRVYEQAFADNAKWNGAKVGPILADGDNTAYEMWMDFQFGDYHIVRTQLALQTWKDGQIVKETFYYKG